MNHAQETRRPANICQDGDYAIPAYKVERFGQVYDGQEEDLVFPSALFLQLPDGEDHIYGRYFQAEHALRVWVDYISKLLYYV